MSSIVYSDNEIKEFLKDRKCTKCSSKVSFINTDEFNNKIDYLQCGNCKEFYTYTFPGMNETPKMESCKQEEFKPARSPEFVYDLQMQIMRTLYRRATPSTNWDDLLKSCEKDQAYMVIPSHKYEISLLTLVRTIIEKAIKYKFSSRELYDVVTFVFSTETPVPKIKSENIYYYSFFKEIFVWIKKKYKFV